jgi:Na+/H+-dicarboxylate symporter/ABC-type amino acid transport substrate-binding protein
VAAFLLVAAQTAMTSSRKILAGLGAGILVGVFLGERAAALEWAADGFVRLLQMTVLPYVTVSIVGSLGALNPSAARLLALRAGGVLLVLWAIALGFALLIPMTFPDVESATFFSTTLVQPRHQFDLMALYIPSNPFHSLANSVVPAVVLFSIIVGIALIGVERKQVLIDLLQVAAEALARATRFVGRLTPYGLFAIAAHASGTLSLDDLGRLQIYLLAYCLATTLVSLWVLPGLVAALTPIPAREILRKTHDALITAFAAGDLFIVLPSLIEASKQLIAQYVRVDERVVGLPEVLVPASFNFPHTGKLMSISFILFAGWFSDAAVPAAEYPRVAATGLLTFFGSLNAAVPFLLDLFRIPADTFELFLASGVINARFGTLAAAMHTVTVALLGTCAMTGTLTWRRGRLFRFALVTTVLTVGILGGMRVLSGRLVTPEYSRQEVLASMHLLRNPVEAVVHRTMPAFVPEPPGGTLAAIRRRGIVRVGYLPDALPYAFFNGRGDLVGFDVDMAHRLAAELEARLELVPVDPAEIDARLAEGSCDLIMSGVAVTTLRASRTLFSEPYLDETLAFVVTDESRDRFLTWDAIAAQGAITIASPNVPYYLDKLRARLPRARLRPFERVTDVLEQPSPDVGAIAMPAERGSTWTLIYPQFTVVVPEPAVIKVPLAYALSRHDQELGTFINTWIQLKRRDGTIDDLYQYWILGRNAAPRQPRWSVIRNVLHWVD